jgi:pyruvate formate-lyase/glycerol dehydratase family glycyl radical enzyme
MNFRVQKLRQESLEAIPTISIERAKLLTEFYKKNLTLISYPVQRALAFEYLLANKEICINPDELIVGERGPLPKATPTYPEICCHSLQDLEILDSREKIPYKVDETTRRLYETTIIPYWQSATIREIIFSEMTESWIDAYEAGVFTEFMEQRAPGHTVLDDKIYKSGLLDFMAKIESQLQKLDFLNDPDAYHKQEELRAMAICARALIRYAERHAENVLEIAKTETNPIRKVELARIAEVCSRVPAFAPRDFWEALQYYWFVHLGVITELNTWDAFNPGRLDQHLFPFYKAGIEDGSLTQETATELLQCFWIKFNNQPAPPKVGVTAAESGTYTDFATINTGGLKPDGSDGVNEVTYLILDVIKEMRLLQPGSNLQLSKKNPDRYLKKALEIIKTGFGQPSIFNADVVVQEMVRVGKSIEDARNGGTSGCVETGAFGKENYNLTGYFNLPKVLEITLNNGIDPRTEKMIGIQTGDPRNFSTFHELGEAFERQLAWFIDVKVRGNNLIERIYATYLPVPFLSMLIDDCIEKGRDYHDGGARYNTSYIQGVGLGTITDSLTTIKYHVFDHKSMGMDELLNILQANFDGYERMRQRLLNKTPKYGNDDDYADEIMRGVFEAYFAAVDGRKNTKGGTYHIDLLPTTVHVYFGSVIGATPDGRKAWEPLSEGISPVQGADRRGPTAVINSAAKMDHIRTGGTLLNQKFTPQLLADQTGIDKLAHFVRAYFKMDGHHIQFNVVDADTLRAARHNPEKYRDLIVRVAGYSDYFCDLSEALQEEIIARTEQTTL